MAKRSAKIVCSLCEYEAGRLQAACSKFTGRRVRSPFLGAMDGSLVTRGIEAGKKTLLLGSVPTVQPQYHALRVQQKTSKFGLSTDAANRQLETQHKAK